MNEKKERIVKTTNGTKTQFLKGRCGAIMLLHLELTEICCYYDHSVSLMRVCTALHLDQGLKDWNLLLLWSFCQSNESVYSFTLRHKLMGRDNTFIVVLHFYNLNKIWSLTSSPLLIYHGVRDLRKSHYGSHASDPMYHPMKMAIARLWKCCLAALHATSYPIGWKRL